LGIKEKMDAVKMATKGTVPIYITGHSLGGALAQIAGAVLGSDQVAACYTFGAPRVGNFYFDLWVKVPSYRVMNYADIVPQIPLPIVYRHSGDPRYMLDHPTPSPSVRAESFGARLANVSRVNSACQSGLDPWHPGSCDCGLLREAQCNRRGEGSISMSRIPGLPLIERAVRETGRALERKYWG